MVPGEVCWYAYKMRILFIAKRCFPGKGGVERHLLQLSQELAGDGHQVKILTAKSAVSHSHFRPINNVSVEAFHTSGGVWESVVANFFLIRRFREFRQADVVHFHDYQVLCLWSVVLLPFLLFFRKKIFITFHGWEGIFPPSRFVIVLRKFAALFASKNISVGRYIEKWYGTKADQIIYGGVDTFPEQKSAGNDICFVGRLAKDTGISMYIHAWKLLCQEFSDISLTVVGDGEMREYVEEVINAESDQRVTLVGAVENPREYMAKSQLVFTSGYLGILEAFSCGRPVVAVYDNALKKDYLETFSEDLGYLDIAESVEDIVDNVRKVLQGRGRQVMPIEIASRCSWDSVKQHYYDIWGKE